MLLMHSVSFQPKIAWLLFIAIVGLLGCTVRNSITPSDSASEFRIVERVVDGDTLAMDNGERVRLIGVNTPETKHPKKPVEHFGQEAAPTQSGSSKVSQSASSLIQLTLPAVTGTKRRRGARLPMSF